MPAVCMNNPRLDAFSAPSEGRAVSLKSYSLALRQLLEKVLKYKIKNV